MKISTERMLNLSNFIKRIFAAFQSIEAVRVETADVTVTTYLKLSDNSDIDFIHTLQDYFAKMFPSNYFVWREEYCEKNPTDPS
jgi:F0F1-type ATP synthase delta subunit